MNPLNASRRELDSVVVNIELTLVSIIQGVALFFLTDNAPRHSVIATLGCVPLCRRRFVRDFIFWSRSVIHTLILIKWPLEFGHNFFYIGCALGEAILFSRLDRPLAWFKVSATYAVVVWLLFIYDMRLIRAGVSESTNDAERNLYARARGDQLLNIWLLVPLLFVFNLGCAVVIWRWPDLFLTRGGHVWLISAQLISFIVYLVYIASYFKTIASLVLRSHEQD